MTRLHMPHMPARPATLGLTLVELMVALAISLTLVVAASMMFLNTRFAQHASDERGSLQETGQLVMEIIGGQIANAGFYPVANVEAGTSKGANMSNALLGYGDEIKLVAGEIPPVGLAAGVYGCSGKVVKADFSGCAANDEKLGAPGSDSLTLAYFTSDAYSRDVGTRADCTRSDVANDNTYNAETRVGSAAKNSTTAEGVPPAAPLLGANQFMLEPLEYVNNAGATVQTYQLACRGNGNGTGTVALVPGVVQMTFRYGVITDGTGAPTRYMTANEINTDSATEVVVGDAKLSGWARVASVRVCVVVRSLNAATSSVSGQTINDCAGTPITPAAGAVYRTFTQVFGVKNRNQNTVGL